MRDESVIPTSVIAPADDAAIEQVAEQAAGDQLQVAP